MWLSLDGLSGHSLTVLPTPLLCPQQVDGALPHIWGHFPLCPLCFHHSDLLLALQMLYKRTGKYCDGNEKEKKQDVEERELEFSFRGGKRMPPKSRGSK